MRLPIQNSILIAGPTASGKSALALALAAQHDGVIVNADASQVYGVLRLLTARPSEADIQAAPHRLYGHIDPSVAYSTGAWMRDVSAVAEQGALAGKTPIFVGGTGLYFTALTRGLSQMPEIPATIREQWRLRLKAEGAQNLHRLLQSRDPDVAARLQPADGQRIVRALEVLEASGRSIAYWRESRTAPLVDAVASRMMVVEPDREDLAQRIDIRFDRMMREGALDEVKALMELGLDPALPAMKAIGVRELGAALRGEIARSEAERQAKAVTRQYAKRQMTWFRHQFGPEWQRISL